MIRAVNVRVTVHATAIERKDIEARRSLMAGQKVDMTLLTKLMWPPREQAHVIRAVCRMTGKAILLHGRMFIKQRPSLFSMAGVTKLVGRVRRQHFLALAAVGIVTGCAGDFHSHGLPVPRCQATVRPVLSAE